MAVHFTNYVIFFFFFCIVYTVNLIDLYLNVLL